MKVIITILFILFLTQAHSQQVSGDNESDYQSSQLEDFAEDQEEESENDYDIQQLKFFSAHPLDINGSDLEQLPLLDPTQISNLVSYRKLLGDIIDVHELQAVPGFNLELIRSILPYITVKKDKLTRSGVRERFTQGEHSIIIRPSIIPEIAKGFRSSPDRLFSGSRPAFFLRYKYEFKNLMQYGFVADKDAGEKFFTHGAKPEFLSFHFFARKVGIIKSLALGDFTINLGQGLIHWQNQAFHKSSSVLSIKRQGETLRPYNSAGEYNFHRGFAVTLTKRSRESTFFISRKSLTANISDSAISSIITSGMHRTKSEMDDKNAAFVFASGATFKQKFNGGHIGLNAIYHNYSLPLLKRDEPYNHFSIKGMKWVNASADYSYTYRNFHLFGEIAADKKGSLAYINGVMSAISPTVDLAMLHRHISMSYQSVSGNAFTENTMPSNENGFYSGISLKPHLRWRIDMYTDLFSFPWFKYRLDAPSNGFAYLIQITWKPNKQTEIYSRIRYRLKPLNIEGEEEDNSAPGAQTIQHWRTHISHQLNRYILIRSRVEVSTFSHQMLKMPAGGYLFYADVSLKPAMSLFSGNFRFQAFEADIYETRIYAYENDLLFVSSTPSFYNNGVRCYLNIKGKFRVKILNNSVLTVNLKAATTVYNNISTIGTGPGAIPGNRLSSLKMQVFLVK